MAAAVTGGGDYFDIDDILAEAEEVPVTFKHEIEGVGFLDPSSDQPNIKADTKVSVPYWLAVALFDETKENRQFVVWSLPKTFDARFRARLIADPKAVDLCSHSKYFFEFGRKLALRITAAELGVTLRAALMARYSELLAFDPKHKAVEYRPFLARMANVEAARTSLSTTTTHHRPTTPPPHHHSLTSHCLCVAVWDCKLESDAASTKWRSQKSAHLLPSYVTTVTPEHGSSVSTGFTGAAPSVNGGGAMAAAAAKRAESNRKRRFEG